ncbi:hypothetical protein [Priestia flexa]|uniref:hypothetical protein n=1 Tax=Priestia flexa TaxID=86664 RepID=UPI00047393F6|nr:hypothetical protein [Priestia flexa]
MGKLKFVIASALICSSLVACGNKEDAEAIISEDVEQASDQGLLTEDEIMSYTGHDWNSMSDEEKEHFIVSIQKRLEETGREKKDLSVDEYIEGINIFYESGSSDIQLVAALATAEEMYEQ